MQVGMTIDFTQDTITGGHYFTARNLKDIPIASGVVHKGRIAIHTQDGSVFDFRFKGNGSENGQPLDFENSVGLIGTRRNARRVERVTLSFIGMGQLSEGRRYASFTDLSDPDFEAIIRKWRIAVLTGNYEAAAKYTRFPLRVNGKHGHQMIRNAAQLSQQWDRIFTPAYLLLIKKDMPHDMWGDKSGLVMLGNGDVWFGDNGIEVLNLPD